MRAREPEDQRGKAPPLSRGRIWRGPGCSWPKGVIRPPKQGRKGERTEAGLRVEASKPVPNIAGQRRPIPLAPPPSGGAPCTQGQKRPRPKQVGLIGWARRGRGRARFGKWVRAGAQWRPSQPRTCRCFESCWRRPVWTPNRPRNSPPSRHQRPQDASDPVAGALRSGPSPNLAQWSRDHDLWFLGLLRGQNVSSWYLQGRGPGPQGYLESYGGQRLYSSSCPLCLRLM